jgi:peptide/nickel transport system substrate-binding protein
VNNPGQFILELTELIYSNLDPATNSEPESSGLNSIICETLYDYNGDSITDLVPTLASAPPDWNEDGAQINITLKQRITFHDGTPFKAWVYKYSIDRVT